MEKIWTKHKKINTTLKTKVFVAMSGGVDSSVAAALLLKQGYAVTGVFMKNWSDTQNLIGVCQWRNEKRDALRVAARLKINLITLDFEKEYKDKIITYLFNEYKKGRTPNPDVWCNRFIKFGVLLNEAKKIGMQKIATGHYAGVQFKDNKYNLVCAKDKKKDQTYFLHQLTQQQLRYVLFPLANLYKKEVREIARSLQLPTAEKEESMGICFVGEVEMKKFLQQKIQKKPGNIILQETGGIIGEHEGLAFYTIGQRHGMAQKGTKAPLYVINKNKKKNELIVGLGNNPLLYSDCFQVKNFHWIANKPEFPFKCRVRLRHGGELQKATLFDIINGKGIKAQLQAKVRITAPGQFLVIYKKYNFCECLGGGVID